MSRASATGMRNPHRTTRNTNPPMQPLPTECLCSENKPFKHLPLPCEHCHVSKEILSPSQSRMRREKTLCRSACSACRDKPHNTHRFITASVTSRLNRFVLSSTSLLDPMIHICVSSSECAFREVMTWSALCCLACILLKYSLRILAFCSQEPCHHVSP